MIDHRSHSELSFFQQVDLITPDLTRLHVVDLHPVIRPKWNTNSDEERVNRMAKRKFSEEQILAVVKQLEAGRTAAEMAREVGVSTFTIYSWKAKYGGMESSEIARGRAIEDENARMKRIIANLSLENDAMKRADRKKTPGALAAKSRGEGPPRAWREPTRRVPNRTLPTIGCSISRSARR